MKKITLCLLLILSTFTLYGQIVISPTSPHFENFEAGAGGWASTAGFPNEWQLGTPVAPKANILTNGGGTKSWITDLGNGVAPSNGDGSYENNALYYLVSPTYDFSALTIAGSGTISFDHKRQLESGWDGVQMQYSIDGGMNWTVLGSTSSGGTNWYDRATLNANEGFNCWNGTAGWITSSHTLPCSVIGQANVKFRFVMYSDVSVTYDGFGFDNLSLTIATPTPIVNVAVHPTAAIVAPVSGINLTASQALSVTVENLGNVNITSLNFNVTVTGPNNTTFTETIPVALNPCPPADTVTVNLATTLNMALYGFYDISVTVNVPGDVDLSNNTTTKRVENRRRVTTYPYSENFDGSTNTGWYPHPGLQIGATQWTLANPPANTFINSAASPSAAWITGTNGNYVASAQTALLSPIFDLSTFSDASKGIISFDRIFDIANDGDRVQVYYTTDQNAAAAGFNNLDDAAWAGLNWHNLPNGFDGLKKGWTPSRELLTQVNGQANVRFLIVLSSNATTTTDGNGAGIDNIFIGKSGLTDLAVTQVVAPTSGVDKRLPQTVTVRLENVGADAITGATMSYKISGPNGVQTATQSATFGTPIATGATQNYIFAVPANLAMIGTYDFEIGAVVTGDVYTTNNALTKSTGGTANTGSATAVVVHVPLAGGAPINLDAVAGTRKVLGVDRDSIRVTWTDASTAENGFILERATDITGVGNWEIIAGRATLPASSTSYNDFAIFANTQYYYRVQYSYSGGLSDYSNLDSAKLEKEANTLKPYQAVLTAKAEYQKASLEWTRPLAAHAIKKFEVYFGIEVDGVPSNPNVRIATTEDTKFTAIGLVNGFNYSFIVKPVMGDGKYYQNLSNIAYARPSVILDANEFAKQISFNVYPNPNNGNFTIQLEGKQSEKLNVRVVNVAGQEVYSNEIGHFNGNLTTNIDLNNIASGLYIVIVETDGGMIQKKVSVNK